MQLIHADMYSNHADVLTAYSVAESIVQGHKVLLVAPDQVTADSLLSLLPLHMGSSTLPLSASQEGTTDTAAQVGSGDRATHLKIAHQYGEFVSRSIN